MLQEAYMEVLVTPKLFSNGKYLKKLYPSGDKPEHIWSIVKLSPLTWPMEC